MYQRKEVLNMNASLIRMIRPSLTRTPTGWLAVSEPGSPLRIGVVGSTEEEARAHFDTELSKWALLREQPAR